MVVTRMMIRDPQGTVHPLRMRPANLARAQSHTHPPSSTHPLLQSTGPRLPVVFTFYHHLRPKGLFFATSPFPSPSLHLLRVSQNSSPLLLHPHAIPSHRPSVSSSRLLPNTPLRNPEPTRCHSGIFTPSNRHHDLSDQPLCEVILIELLSDNPRRHTRSVTILEGPNVTAVLSQLALNLSDLQDIDCRDRFSLLATQRYVRSSRLSRARAGLAQGPRPSVEFT